MTTITTPTVHCQACGYELTRATGVNHADKPVPGDISLCFNCGMIGVFTDDLKSIVRMPDKDFAAFKMQDPEGYRLVMKAVTLIRSRHERP